MFTDMNAVEQAVFILKGISTCYIFNTVVETKKKGPKKRGRRTKDWDKRGFYLFGSSSQGSDCMIPHI